MSMMTPHTATAPYSILEDLLSETHFKPQDEGYALAKEGVAALLGQLVALNSPLERVDKSLIDHLIAEIDARVSLQLDAILHHTDFQRLESRWRSLKFLVDRTNFRENIKIDLLNISKQDLIEDFADTPEIPKSGLYKRVYTAEYGQFGGEPYGAMLSDFQFDHSAQDIKLLQNIASVAAMAHAPFLASASPMMFGVQIVETLPNLKDIKSIFEGQLYAK